MRTTKLRKAIVPLLALGLGTSAGHATADTPVDLFVLLTGFSAKETCSCAFVVEQTDEYCTTFGQVKDFPSVVIHIDRAAKTVTSEVTGARTRTARFSATDGCLLDMP